MGSNGPKGDELDSDTIEIHIRTMDFKSYNLRVNKQVPVCDLKDQIAFATSVLVDCQRIIYGGTILEDDQLLSSYHVEDGHVLHLVVRQPDPPDMTDIEIFVWLYLLYVICQNIGDDDLQGDVAGSSSTEPGTSGAGTSGQGSGDQPESPDL